MAKINAKKAAKNNSNNLSNNGKQVSMSKIVEEDETKKLPDPDEEINSGFANYLRSSEGI